MSRFYGVELGLKSTLEYGIRVYPSECLCLAYRVTCYRAAIGPPIIYSPTHELAVSA